MLPKRKYHVSTSHMAGHIVITFKITTPWSFWTNDRKIRETLKMALPCLQCAIKGDIADCIGMCLQWVLWQPSNYIKMIIVRLGWWHSEWVSWTHVKSNQSTYSGGNWWPQGEWICKLILNSNCGFGLVVLKMCYLDTFETRPHNKSKLEMGSIVNLELRELAEFLCEKCWTHCEYLGILVLWCCLLSHHYLCANILALAEITLNLFPGVEMVLLSVGRDCIER